MNNIAKNIDSLSSQGPISGIPLYYIGIPCRTACWIPLLHNFISPNMW